MLAFTSCSKDEKEFKPIQVGDKVPAFQVTLNDGSTYNSVMKSTQPTLIVFFNTTCKDCQYELPIIQQLYDDKELNFRLVLISRAQSASDIETYWKENNLTMPYSAQEDRTIYNMFAESIIPRGYLCNKENVVTYMFTDSSMPTLEELKKAIKSM